MTLPRTWVAGLACWAVLLGSGCHAPHADITTTQDPKYPLGKQSKIAFPNEASAADVDSRIAGEFMEERMHAMGFTIVPIDQADYLARTNEEARDFAVSEPPAEPSAETTVGAGSDGLFTGIGLGIPLGPPQVITIHRTELDLTLETAQSPPIVIWQGKILAESADVAAYRAAFFDALISRLGLTFDGSVRLDKPNEVAP